MYLVLNEFLDLAPINLSRIGSTDGVDIYSSDKIQNTVKNWISFSPTTRNVKNAIEQGMNNNKILVGYADKSKFSFIKRRLKTWMPTNLDETAILGWFSNRDNSIAILLDSNVTVAGKSIIYLPSVLVHELCHMAAYEDTKNFISKTMNQYLLPFFKRLLFLIDNRTQNIPEDKLASVLIFLCNYVELNEAMKDPNIHVIANTWEKYFMLTGAPKEETKKMTIKILAPFLKFITEKLKPEYNDIAEESVEYYYRAYETIKVNCRSYTIPGQEARSPSEVVSIANQFNPSPRVLSIINSLNMGRSS